LKLTQDNWWQQPEQLLSFKDKEIRSYSTTGRGSGFLGERLESELELSP